MLFVSDSAIVWLQRKAIPQTDPRESELPPKINS